MAYQLKQQNKNKNKKKNKDAKSGGEEGKEKEQTPEKSPVEKETKKTNKKEKDSMMRASKDKEGKEVSNDAAVTQNEAEAANEKNNEEEDAAKENENNEGSGDSDSNDEEVDDEEEKKGLADQQKEFETKKRALMGENQPEVKKARIVVFILLLLILALAIAYFILSSQLNKNMLKNIKNIEYSEKRKNWLIDINLRLKQLILISSDNKYTDESISPLALTSAEKAVSEATSRTLLKSSAINLKDVQTQLSLQTSDMSASQLDKINPNNVKLKYLTSTSQMASSYMYTIWQAMLEIVVASFRVTDLDLASINQSDPAVYLISNNSLNSVLLALGSSTNEIINQIMDSKSFNMSIFFFSFIAATVAVVLGTVILIPVISNAKTSKDVVLKLFVGFEKEDVKKYYNKCEKFKANTNWKEQQGEDEEDKFGSLDKDTGNAENMPEREKSKKDLKGMETKKENQPTNQGGGANNDEKAALLSKNQKMVISSFMPSRVIFKKSD